MTGDSKNGWAATARAGWGLQVAAGPVSGLASTIQDRRIRPTKIWLAGRDAALLVAGHHLLLRLSRLTACAGLVADPCRRLALQRDALDGGALRPSSATSTQAQPFCGKSAGSASAPKRLRCRASQRLPTAASMRLTWW